MDGDLKSAVFLADMEKIRAILRRMMASDQPGYMLLNVFLQPLVYTSYIPTITVPIRLIFFAYISTIRLLLVHSDNSSQ